MKKLPIVLGLLLAASLVFAAPDAGYDKISLVVPKGDPQAGREAFVALYCTSCHVVVGEADLPKPVTDLPVPALGPKLGALPAGELASAIVAPSHKVSKGVFEETEGSLSPMADFSGAMSVRQLVDLVAFIRSLGEAG